ncbi:MAG: hypothetical protein JNK09_11705 [Prolixibacteraceae bacterium]|nr:hypothetical protein [Prolixibacteraceae bacterium]
MERHCEQHRKHSGSFWAYVLIIFGVLWLLKQTGWDIHFPNIGEFFSSIGHFFGSLAQWSFGAAIPVLIILIGVGLILGRRFLGALLFVLLLLLLLPNFLIIPGILMVLFFPIILIIIGIIILSKLF